MSEINNMIYLEGSKCYITSNPTDAFRVISGRVLVFVLPERRWGDGRKSLICEMEEGKIIPAFCYQDQDFVKWKFCFTAVEKAEIEVMEYGSTNLLKDRFAKEIKLKHYFEEGYDSGLVEQYKINIVREDVLIKRNRNLKNTTFLSVIDSISSSFKRKNIAVSTEKSGNVLYDCVNTICSASGIPIAPIETVKEACGDNFGLSGIARISRFSFRNVRLDKGWEKKDSGPFLVLTEDGRPLACLPGKMKITGAGSYVFYNPKDGSVVPVTSGAAENIRTYASTIYRPLPSRKLSRNDLVSFCKSSIPAQDLFLFVVFAVITALIGLIIPTVNQKLFDVYIPGGDKANLIQVLFLLVSFMIANVMISVVKNLCRFRITSKINYSVINAVFDRVFNLPGSFFRKFDSADLTKRVMSIGGIVDTSVSFAVSLIVSLAFIFVSLMKMISYSEKLTLLGLTILFTYGVFYYLISKYALKRSVETEKIDSEAGSLLYQYIKGISKIRIAGVEDRAIYEYIKPYIRLREKLSDIGKISLLNNAVSSVTGTILTVVFYIVAAKHNNLISVGSFVAFTSLFGLFEAYAMDIISGIVSIISISPSYERFKPILDEKPEFDDGCELPGDVSGMIEINNVSFSYDKNEPVVLNNISLTINPGEYIGIVGSSGSGKSTLMKLILGFEKPTTGKIYFDNKDIEKVDKRELRKKMGVVLQDGKLISGSINDNIKIAAPDATDDDITRALEAVGLDEDIKKMPMGRETMLNEESSTISGGQLQRILIARAIISSPHIIIMDEATSALDNTTQKIVSDTIGKIDATRIIIAHRLSTVMNCDRLIVLDSGTIVEEGTYDELMEKKGYFYQLAARQII